MGGKIRPGRCLNTPTKFSPASHHFPVMASKENVLYPSRSAVFLSNNLLVYKSPLVVTWWTDRFLFLMIFILEVKRLHPSCKVVLLKLFCTQRPHHLLRPAAPGSSGFYWFISPQDFSVQRQVFFRGSEKFLICVCSLPLRFWVNILRNPHFILDVHVTEVVDASLHVIAQTFMDACTKTEHKLTRVSDQRSNIQNNVQSPEQTHSNQTIEENHKIWWRQLLSSFSDCLCNICLAFVESLWRPPVVKCCSYKKSNTFSNLD